MQTSQWTQKFKTSSWGQWWLENRTLAKTVLALLLGLVIIQIVSLYVFSFYLISSTLQVDRLQFSQEFVKTVRFAKALPLDQLPLFLGDIRGRNTTLAIADQPVADSQVISYSDPRDLGIFASKNYLKLIASVPLSNGKYLIIRGHIEKHPWFVFGFIAANLVLLFFMFLLCLWAIRRVALPTQQFIRAAKRFGVDVQSPPLAEVGTPEIKDLSKAFNEMQERIRRLLNDRTQMLAAISHDLRTPITRLQLRAEHFKDTPQYEKMIADLTDMERMISSILSFARDYVTTEAAERIDLNALLESLSHDLLDTGFEVKYQAHEERILFWGRLSALKRAFTNLIENAVKYGQRAEVVLTHSNDQIQIKVSDEGPGIPPEEMENVFAPFYRVDRSRSPKISGSGLGLAVARDIIRAHGGEIRLRNRVPKGLTVTVILPYVKPEKI